MSFPSCLGSLCPRHAEVDDDEGCGGCESRRDEERSRNAPLSLVGGSSKIKEMEINLPPGESRDSRS